MGKLGQILVARGWITVQQLTRALKNQNVVGGRLGTCLLEMDALTEDQLAKGLSEQLGVPAAVVDEMRGIPEEVRELLPSKLARRCRAVPFRALGGRLDVAMLDARNLACQDEIAFATGKRVKVHVGLEIRIYEALEKYYDEECPSRFAHLLDRLNRSRYMWEREDPERATAPAEPTEVLDMGPFAPPPKLVPPPLPEPALPPSPRRERALHPLPPLAPVSPIGGAPPSRPLSVPLLRPPETARPAAAAELVDLPLRRPPPPPLRSVPLTPEEKAALAAPERSTAAPEPPAPPSNVVPIAAAAPAPPSPPAPAPAAASSPVKTASAKSPATPPATPEEVEDELRGTTDLEEVARLLLAFLAGRYRRAALFQVARNVVTGWRLAGEGVDNATFARFAVGFDQPSIFLNLRQGSGIHMGSLPPMPAHRELARAWGGELPRDCVMLPVRLKDRLVTVIYADRAENGAPGLPLDELRRLAAATAGAFERCIMGKKQRSTGV
jgi:hypothetical protein